MRSIIKKDKELLKYIKINFNREIRKSSQQKYVRSL